MSNLRSFSDCVFGVDPWEPSHVIRDSRDYKRATAINSVADEYGIDFQSAHCQTVYVRWLSRQEIWDDGAGERWWDGQGHFVDGKWVPAPDDGQFGLGYPPTPPDDWEPDPEQVKTYDFCSKDSPGAVKVYKIETGL